MLTLFKDTFLENKIKLRQRSITKVLSGLLKFLFSDKIYFHTKMSESQLTKLRQIMWIHFSIKNYLCIGLILLFCLIRLVVSAWIPVYPNTDYIITFPQLWGNATGLVILNVKSSQNMQRWVHILRLRPLLEVLLWDWLTDLGTDLNMCTHQHVLVLFSYHGALHQIFFPYLENNCTSCVHTSFWRQQRKHRKLCGQRQLPAPFNWLM